MLTMKRRCKIRENTIRSAQFPLANQPVDCKVLVHVHVGATSEKEHELERGEDNSVA